MHLSVRLLVMFCNDLEKGKTWTATKVKVKEIKEAVPMEMKADSPSCSERKVWQVLQPSFDHPTGIVE